MSKFETVEVNPMLRIAMSVICVGLLGLTGCSKTRAPSARDAVRRSLDQAGLKDVSVSEDRDKGVLSLGGHVATDDEKARAASIAKANAGNEVVANEIAVLPPNQESTAKTVNSDLDGAIKKNLDAVLVQNHMNKAVKFSVKNQVVELTGNVDTQNARAKAEQIATNVPDVKQVVNELR